MSTIVGLRRLSFRRSSRDANLCTKHGHSHEVSTVLKEGGQIRE